FSRYLCHTYCHTTCTGLPESYPLSHRQGVGPLQYEAFSRAGRGAVKLDTCAERSMLFIVAAEYFPFGLVAVSGRPRLCPLPTGAFFCLHLLNYPVADAILVERSCVSLPLQIVTDKPRSCVREPDKL